MKSIRPHLCSIACLLAFAMATVASGAVHAAHEWIESADVAHAASPLSHQHPVAPHPAHDSDHCAVCIQIAAVSQYVLITVAQVILAEPAVTHPSLPPEITIPAATRRAPAISPRAPPLA